jgi:Xaa-Pro aminopeptidase
MRLLPVLLLLTAFIPSAHSQPAVHPPGPFAPSVYKARRAKLMATLGKGIAVLYARGKEDRDGYRQDSDFEYLTGVNEAGAILILAPQERTYKEFLLLKPRNPESERWVGERMPLSAALRKKTGFEKIRRTSGLSGKMIDLTRRAKVLHLINQPGSINSPISPEKKLYGKLQSRIPGLSVKDRSYLLPMMRSIKEPRELARMRKAIAATMEAHRAVAVSIKPGIEENWIASNIDVEFKRAGATRPAFSSIVGSGEHSTILHYPDHNKTIELGDLVVVDIGAEYARYAADITRTYPADGYFSDEQKKIYNIVLRAQKAALAKVRAGAYFEDIGRTARRVIEEAGYGDYYIHGLGHFVGLDVHDAGRMKQPLRAGMVITIEPGIYIPEKALGVRIEDMVLVTKRGYEHLTKELPSTVSMVERMMGPGKLKKPRFQ